MRGERTFAEADRGKTPRAWRLLAWLPGLLLLLALIVVIGYRSEEERLLDLLRRSQPAWLLVAAALQAASYVCAAAVWVQVFRAAQVEVSLRSLVPLAVARLFLDQAMPSGGLGGRLFIARAFARRGVRSPIAMAAILVDLITVYFAYALVVLGALAILARRHDLDRAILAAVLVFSTMVIAIPLGAMWLSRGKKPPRWVRRLPRLREPFERLSRAPRELVRNPRVLLSASGCQLAIFLLDAATLWVLLRAVGRPLGVEAAFASFAIASVTGTVVLLPGGLGAFEAACAAMLTLFEAPAEAALAATLLLRGFTYWLPMLPGLWLSRRELRNREGKPAQPGA